MPLISPVCHINFHLPRPPSVLLEHLCKCVCVCVCVCEAGCPAAYLCVVRLLPVTLMRVSAYDLLIKKAYFCETKCVFVCVCALSLTQGESGVFLLQSQLPNKEGGRNCSVSQNQALPMCVCVCGGGGGGGHMSLWLKLDHDLDVYLTP